MILKGNQRGHARDLARHLMNARTNDHVEVHEVRGLAAADVREAFAEIEAMGKATPRGTAKPFYALSLSPPEEAAVTIPDFEAAIEAAENRLGLQDQPRVVIFHEKEGRRHAHAVWSRIDPEEVTAINIAFDREKLTRLSRDLYHQHGWTAPRGVEEYDSAKATNFTHSEWMQFQRTKVPPETHKTQIRAAWDLSDDLGSFAAALEDRGYMLANGRRGFVALDLDGEAHSVMRATGERKKAVEARLGDPSRVRTVEQCRDDMQARQSAAMGAHREQVAAQQARELRPYHKALAEMRGQQRADRALLDGWQAQRFKAEETERANRLRGGIMGLFDRLTFKAGRIASQNQAEREAAAARDQAERDQLIQRQLEERRALKEAVQNMQKRHGRELHRLNAEQAALLRLERSDEARRAMAHMNEQERQRFIDNMIREEERRLMADQEREHRHSKGRSRDDDYTPEL